MSCSLRLGLRLRGLASQGFFEAGFQINPEPRFWVQGLVFTADTLKVMGAPILLIDASTTEPWLVKPFFVMA